MEKYPKSGRFSDIFLSLFMILADRLDIYPSNQYNTIDNKGAFKPQLAEKRSVST